MHMMNRIRKNQTRPHQQKQLKKALTSLQNHLERFDDLGEPEAEWAEIIDRTETILRHYQPLLTAREREHLQAFLTASQRQDRGKPVRDLSQAVQNMLGARGMTLSPLSVVLIIACVALLGGIMTLSQFQGQVSLVIRNAGCPDFPVGAALEPGLRNDIQDLGLELPDSVATDSEEQLYVPRVPASLTLEIRADRQLGVNILGRHFLLPLPGEVDSVQFNGQEVLRGPVTQTLDKNPAHEILILCP